MRKTLLTTALMAATLVTVSACAKRDEGANTAIVNETVPNDPAAADANTGSADTFGNDSVSSGNDTLSLNASGGAQNAQ